MRKDEIISTFHKLELSLAHESLLMDGHVLSKNDTRRVSNAYILQCMCFYDIAKICDTAERGFSRSLSLRNVALQLGEYRKSDVGCVVSQLKSALQLLRLLPDKGMHRYKFEKLCIECGYDRTLSCNRIMNRLLWVLFSNPSIGLFQYVNSAIQFITRLTLRDIDWIEEENLQSYKDFESSLQGLVANYRYGTNFFPDPEIEFIISEMRSVVTEWFHDFSFERAEAQHGYGATNQVGRSEGTAAKYRQMRFSRDTALAAKSIAWIPNYGVWPGLRENIDNSLSRSRAYQSNHNEAITRVQFVPKGINKKRVVSMEDTTNQYLQKIMQDLMRRHFKRHPEMRIDLQNQGLNRDLARLGSTGLRLYGTADLSSASDSVTWELVRQVFCDTPIYPYLVRTRTRNCQLPDGTMIRMEKAYPMGSALCFPIECVIFSSIIAAANRHSGLNTYYRVYGDDMVIHSAIWDLAIHYLKKLGYLVNDEKSFAPGSPFTESCGIECWNGADVSPIRLSRKWDIVSVERGGLNRRHRTTTPSTALSALYDFGNQCYDHCLSTCRAYVIDLFRRNYGEPLFSRNRSLGFISNAVELNSTRKIFWTKGQSPATGHRGYYSVQSVSSNVSPGEDQLRYSKLLDTYNSTSRVALMSPLDRIESACGAASTSVKKRKVPVEWTEMTDTELARLRLADSSLFNQSTR